MLKVKIEDDLRQAYRSFSAPNFEFVRRCLDQRPHQRLKEVLGARFTLQEDTDANDDVSFGFLMIRGSSSWLLRVSMIGPYAVLLRVNPNGNTGIPITDEPANTSEIESEICDLVAEQGLQLLGRDILEQRLDLKLINADDENVRLYQALFQDTDVLPWHPSAA